MTGFYLGHVTIKLGIQQAVGQLLSFLSRQVLHFTTSETSRQLTYISTHAHSDMLAAYSRQTDTRLTASFPGHPA